MEEKEQLSDQETAVAEQVENSEYEPPKIVDSARFETLAQGCDYAGGCFPTPSG